jgi:hypothetical protein
LIHDAHGNIVLIDFDSVCVGPREWDLTPTGLYATSLGWISRAEYDAFVAAYGFDVTAAPADVERVGVGRDDPLHLDAEAGVEDFVQVAVP